jgi:hypothetical protein
MKKYEAVIDSSKIINKKITETSFILNGASKEYANAKHN